MKPETSRLHSQGRTAFLLVLLVVLTLSACAPAAPQPTPTPVPTATPAGPRRLTVMTHDSFAVPDEVVAAFQKEHNAEVQFLKSGDAGTALNKAILAKGKPLADVFYGMDNTFLGRALEQDIFVPYASPLLAKIPVEYQLDPQARALPMDYGDVCLNYDKDFFTSKGIKPPVTLDDLLKPDYKGLLVVQNPATSSPGLSFLLATIGHYGADHYLDYWKGLVQNDVLVVNDWESAYYQEFTRGGGQRPIVVSYSSSPAFEVIYSQTPIEQPPTAAITQDRSCFRQVEFAGILKGAADPQLAQEWIDFMLSTTFQESMPLQMFVFPVNPEARLDPRFTQFLSNPTDWASVDPQEIARNREKWIQDWTQAVLR